MPSNDNALFCMVLPPIAWYCMLLHGMAQYCILILLLHCIAWYLMVLNGSKLSPFMPQCGHKLCWVRVCHASVASLPILCCCWGLVCPKKVGQVGGSVAGWNGFKRELTDSMSYQGSRVHCALCNVSFIIPIIPLRVLASNSHLFKNSCVIITSKNSHCH